MSINPVFRNLVAFNSEFQKAMDVPDKVAKVALSIINLLKTMGIFVVTKVSTTLVGVIMVDDAINPFTTGINILNGDWKNPRVINLLAVQILNAVKAAHYFELIKDFKWLPEAVAPIPFAAVINPLVISLSILGIKENRDRYRELQGRHALTLRQIAYWNAPPQGTPVEQVRREIVRWENLQANIPIEKQKAINAMIADTGKIVTASLAFLPVMGVILNPVVLASVGVLGTCALGWRTGYNVWANSQLRDIRA